VSSVFEIDRARGLIQEEDGGIAQEGPLDVAKELGPETEHHFLAGIGVQ